MTLYFQDSGHDVRPPSAAVSAGSPLAVERVWRHSLAECATFPDPMYYTIQFFAAAQLRYIKSGRRERKLNTDISFKSS